MLSQFSAVSLKAKLIFLPLVMGIVAVKLPVVSLVRTTSDTSSQFWLLP